jgi:tetraacyldisaccharide 4'-kinase
MVEYLVRLLQPKYSLAILSRGYGRKTKGFRLATNDDDADSLGDEPFQYLHFSQ